MADEIKLEWHNARCKIKDLMPHPNNPRQLNEKQAEVLKKSLEKFNLVEIPAIDTDNTLLAGHQRMKIMLLLGRGEEEIDVRMPNRKLTDEERDSYNILSNKATGEWDWNVLANWDQNLLLDSGFSKLELSKGFDLNLKSEEKDDKVPEVDTNTPPIVQLADVWLLGKHRLMCGNSTKLEDVQKLMDDKKADLLFTDPPYNIDYENMNMMRDGAKDWSKNSEWKDKMTDEQFQEFLIAVFANAKVFLKEFAHVYIWFAFKFYRELLIALEKNEINHDKVPIIWKKQTTPLSWARYHRNYEPCLFGGKETITAKNGGRWFGPNNETSVWEINTDNSASYVHPTQKPTALAERAIKNSSQQDEIVLDLFGGSGSTLIACEKMIRSCYTMELDPKYCDVIIKRWEEFTEQKAIKLS